MKISYISDSKGQLLRKKATTLFGCGIQSIRPNVEKETNTTWLEGPNIEKINHPLGSVVIRNLYGSKDQMLWEEIKCSVRV